VAAIVVVAMIVWQGLATHGAPDPTQPNTSPTVAFLDIGILVFREGLECILVLAAITASMTGAKRPHRRPVAVGAGVAFIASLITWFIAVRIVSSLSDNVPALDLQAATGLLAVIVLLVIMNWFFHKIYWGGWIRAHNRRRKALLEGANGNGITHSRLWWGLILLGFTSLYREGFEVVLFLQSYYLRLGGGVVLKGALLGLTLGRLPVLAQQHEHGEDDRLERHHQGELDGRHGVGRRDRGHGGLQLAAEPDRPRRVRGKQDRHRQHGP
jgi:high-affinity iron transporter